MQAQSPQTVDDVAGDGERPGADFTVSDILLGAWRRVPGNKWAAWKGLLMYLGVWAALTLVLSQLGRLYGLDPKAAVSPLPGLLDELVIGITLLPMCAGIWFYGVALSRGLSPNVFSLFGWYEHTLKLLLVTILCHLMIVLGLLLLVLPGIYLIVAYQLALPLAVDQQLGPWEAMEKSRRIISRCWFRVLLLDLIFTGMTLVSFLLLGIPLIWVFPTIMLAWGIFYEQLVGVQEQTMQRVLFRQRRTGLRRSNH